MIFFSGKKLLSFYSENKNWKFKMTFSTCEKRVKSPQNVNIGAFERQPCFVEMCHLLISNLLCLFSLSFYREHLLDDFCCAFGKHLACYRGQLTNNNERTNGKCFQILTNRKQPICSKVKNYCSKSVKKYDKMIELQAKSLLISYAKNIQNKF